MSRRTRRVVFWIYAAILFTLTHWPRFQIVSPFERPDLVAHLVAFSLWTILFILTDYCGRSRAAIARAALIAAAYACVDEGLQGIPVLHRSVRLDDLLANLAGVVLGAVVMLAATGMNRAKESE